MKSVLISIKPYWVFLIIAKIMGWNIGKEKTVEVRKNYPKSENWNRSVKIYCSKDKRSFSKIPKEYQPFMEQLLGKVIGECVCDWCEAFTTNYYTMDRPQTLRIARAACLGLYELMEYEGNAHCLYGWHISDLVIYDAPKELFEFQKSPRKLPFDPVQRPPQSWCYVEGC